MLKALFGIIMVFSLGSFAAAQEQDVDCSYIGSKSTFLETKACAEQGFDSSLLYEMNKGK